MSSALSYLHLQCNIMLPAPHSTRLVTIIAHVDHGKTTLADSLIESNGIISERLAGTLRYLDSDAEEQRRGITMKASSIGLRHTYFPSKINQQKHNSSSAPQNMIIHLIDSPGHVDFSVEVTSSLLLCDSAILIVDAVEGLCARTHSLLREAYLHQLVPVLVINKIDRLCLELGLDTTEAYVRIRELIESMNAVCASMLNSAILEEEDVDFPIVNAHDDLKISDLNGHNKEKSECKDDDDEEENVWNFDPAKGNIVFASALHGWGFTIPTLARSLFKSKTIPFKPPVLRQYLFGDYRYKWETNKVLKWKYGQGNTSKGPMFAEFALAPIWEIYQSISHASSSLGLKSELFTNGRDATVENENHFSKPSHNSKSETAKITSTTSGMERVLASMKTGSTCPSFISSVSNNGTKSIPNSSEEMHELLSRTGASSEAFIASVFLRRYRPLSGAILDAVCEIGPSPADASIKYRPRALALRLPNSISKSDLDEFKVIQEAVRHCDTSDSAPTVAHVCKFTPTNRFSVTDPDLPSNQSTPDGESKNIIMGIARVLSGTLRTDAEEYCTFGPRHTWNEENHARQKIRCYLLMGSSFVRVNSVPAGHICAVYNLEHLQLKNVTLSDRKRCMPLHGFDFGLQPLVKVNVEPVFVSETDTLERALLKLSLADSSVEVTSTARGETILACLGEIHLERCILDLETVYSDHNIKLKISDPITSFCETTEWFENEEDFDAFFDNSSPPLRQVLIPPYCDEEGLSNAKKGRCRAILSGRGAAIGIRIVPLPQSVYECLKSKSIIKGSENDLLMVGNALKLNQDELMLTPQKVFESLIDWLHALDGNGNALFESSSLSFGVTVKGVHSSNGEVYRNEICSLKGAQENYTPAAPDGYNEYQTIQQFIRNAKVDVEAVKNDYGDSLAFEKWKQDMRGSVLGGFQLAMRAGPICEEPCKGIAVILESVEVAVNKPPGVASSYKVAKTITGGMVVTALRSGIRCALITRPFRLVESHLRLTLHSSLTGLGSLHSVLSKRRGKVISDAMVDGTELIRVTATIPQAESFGLAPELLKKSSGEVTAPELVFSHWEVLNEDPFWIPTTEEEREDYGEIIMSGDKSTGLDNNALKYIRMVRKRKGLLVDSSKIITAAEKQRTLSRKK